MAATAASSGVDAFVSFGIAIPYVAQARKIAATRDASGFDTRASLIIMVSATLRVFYWLALPATSKFGTPLLIQAAVAILSQVHLLRNSIEATRSASPGPERSFLDFRLADFWKWTDLSSFLMAEVCLVLLAMLSSAVFSAEGWYAPALGALSLGIEALLPVPQAISNWRRKSTAGLSGVLISSWFAGDAFKTVYAAAKGEPAPFVACGSFQLCCDVIILVQMLVLYRGASSAAGGGAGGRGRHDSEGHMSSGRDGEGRRSVDGEAAAALQIAAVDIEMAPLVGAAPVGAATGGAPLRVIPERSRVAGGEDSVLLLERAGPASGGGAHGSAVALAVPAAVSPASLVHRRSVSSGAGAVLLSPSPSSGSAGGEAAGNAGHLLHAPVALGASRAVAGAHVTASGAEYAAFLSTVPAAGAATLSDVHRRV